MTMKNRCRMISGAKTAYYDGPAVLINKKHRFVQEKL